MKTVIEVKILSFEELYTLDFELTSIFAQRQKWIDGVLFKREVPRKSGALIYLNGCTGEYTDLITGKNFYAPLKSLIYLPFGGRYSVLNIESQKDSPDAFLVEFNIVIDGETVSLSEMPQMINTFNPHYIEKIMNETVDCYESLNKSPSILKSKIYDMLTSVSFEIKSKKDEKELSIKPAIEYINKYPYENISIEFLAQMCGLSSGGFRRIFKYNIGKSPKEYILDMKISAAKILLEESEMTVKEISEILNFETVAYFCRFFKLNTKKSPSEYRKMILNIT